MDTERDRPLEPAPSIDDILAKVRSELAALPDENVSKSDATLRRMGGAGFVPVVAPPDDSERIALNQPFYTIEEFAALDEEAFLRNAYRVVLGREMDGVGGSYYLPALRNGHIGVVRVLSALRRSAEGKQRGVKIRWLWPAAVVDRLASLPVVGKFFAPLMIFLVRSQTTRRLATHAERHTDLISSINTSFSAIRKNLIQFDRRADITERDVSDLQQELARVREDATKAVSEVMATRQLIARQQAELRRLVDEARAALPKAEAPTPVEALEDHALDAFYVAFENRFRGSTAEIGKRSERYLPIFRQTEAVAAGGIVLDIGCGRGEWLSLLGKHNIQTRGIDLNVSMVAEARALGHDVVEGDVIGYLRTLPEESLAAITGFHIVEHLSFKDLITLFDEAKRVLVRGGIILFETPNPENLVVGACTFHYDPTHQKPLPPDFLRFIAEARGYGESRIIRADTDCDLTQPESGFSPTEINDWFRQPADYALYAQKAHSDRPA